MTDENIEIDVDSAVGTGSDYESGYETSTQSLTSTVQEYIFENGRRYHSYFGPDKSLMPTDEAEQDRLDLHHEIMLELLEGEIHLAPVENPHRILDVGTGTGIWAIDAADKFSSAEVIGTDISPIQPGWVPPNCRFELDDAEQLWTYDTDSFDFIHLRNLAQSISNWAKVLSEAFSCTKPGGWIEHAEFCSNTTSDDDSEGPSFKRVMNLANEALDGMGRPSQSIEKMKMALEVAGFVDIHVVMKKQPFGLWPKDPRMKRIGAMVQLMCETAFEAYSLALLTRFHGMSTEEVKQLYADAWQDVKKREHHSYAEFYVVYGRKPEPESA